MKSVVKNLIILLSLVFVFASCDDEGPDTSIGPVTSLIEPANNFSIVLQPTGNDLYFEWDEVKLSGIKYQIVFDHPNGNFSNPVFAIDSDNGGTKPSLSLSPGNLNSIARRMGLLSSEQGSFKWSVRTIRGLEVALATQSNTMTVTRMAGFDDLPLAVFLTGAGTEVGDNIANALIMQRMDEGIFEIYSRLTAGQPYIFLDNNAGEPKRFRYDFEGQVIREEETPMTVAETGIYHIRLDFNSGTASYRQVLRVALFHNSSQVYLWLPYQGLGVWGRGFALTAGGIFDNLPVAETNSSNRPSGNPVTDNLGTDDRYKFRMVSRPLGAEGDVVTEWRTFLPNDAKPGNSPNPNWYYMIERTNVEQWTNNQIWKIQPGAWMGLNIDVTFVLKGDSPYTHTFVIQ